jgi:uncharacterized protein (UPF0332 family)
MTWQELSEAHGAAASYLLTSANQAHHRAVCGRAYYSSYALVTSKLPQGIRFGRGWQNPEHAKLPGYVNQISNLTILQRSKVKQAIRRLRQRREDADYRPGIEVSVREARESMRDAEEIRRLLI